MKNKTILIIGNGPSILKNKLGEEIDKFQTVARINNYKINNYEKFVGAKTSIWFNGGNQNLRVPTILPKKIIVFVPFEIINNNLEKIKARTSHRIGLNPNEYELTSQEKMKDYELISKIKRPTTGLNSILWAIENYDKIIIHGFDFFQKSKEHYYDNYFFKKIINMKILKKGEKHDNIGEKLFVENLIAEEKVFQLKDCINNNTI